MSEPKSTSKWGAIKKQLNEFSREGLISLIKDLHDASPANKAFLAARFAAGEAGEAVLEEFRQKVIKQFFPTRGTVNYPKLKEARSIIREYRKATSDVAGTLELMMTFVETGTRFTNEFGDIDENFYISLESMLSDFSKMMQSPEGRACYGDFYDRLHKLVADTSGIGWGFSDAIQEEVEALEKALT